MSKYRTIDVWNERYGNEEMSSKRAPFTVAKTREL